MKALNLYGVNDLRYDEVCMPVRKADEVLLKIHACGICGSDIPRVFSTGTYHFPTIIGHEFSGEIVEADDINLVGRKAAVFPLLPCRRCSACQSGDYAQCRQYSYYGSRQDGGMAEFIAVKVANLCMLPDGISYEWGAMGEPAAVALHAFCKSGARSEDSIFIYGIGTISLIIAQWAKSAGLKRIILAGRTEEKVLMARKMGFEAININNVLLDKFIEEDLYGNGIDICIEGTGSSEGLEICLRMAGNFAKIVLLGNPAKEIIMSKDDYWKILRKELEIKGTWNSYFSEYKNDWKQAFSAMQSGVLNMNNIITHRFSLDMYEEAFSLMRNKKEPYLKVMFRIGDSLL